MKRFKKALTATAFTAAVGLLSQQALAATDGALGATSTGTSTVSLTISQLYKVSGFTDFAFGAYTGTGNLTANTDLCVYTNDSTKNYHVLVTNSSGASFAVKNAGGSTIPYAVNWHSAIGTTGNAPVTYNTALAGTNANVTASDCSTGGKSANIQVTLLAAALQAAPSGAYSTTLTVVIEP